MFPLAPILVLVALALQSPSDATSLSAALERAAQYATRLNGDIRPLLATETYQQVLRPYGSNRTDPMRQGTMLGQMGDPKSRLAMAEFALVAAPDAAAWVAYRDIYDIERKPLRPERGRLAAALAESATTQADLRVFTNEALKQNLGSTKRDVNVPTFVLMVVLPANQPRFEFKKKGEKREGGQNYWVVEFVETARPPLARTSDGFEKPCRGEFWVSPADGHILRTHLVFDTLDAVPDMKKHPEKYAYDFPRATVDVVYALDAGLSAWVPVQMEESYTSQVELLTCKSTFASYKRLEQ